MAKTVWVGLQLKASLAPGRSDVAQVPRDRFSTREDAFLTQKRDRCVQQVLSGSECKKDCCGGGARESHFAARAA